MQPWSGNHLLGGIYGIGVPLVNLQTPVTQRQQMSTRVHMYNPTDKGITMFEA